MKMSQSLTTGYLSDSLFLVHPSQVFMASLMTVYLIVIVICCTLPRCSLFHTNNMQIHPPKALGVSALQIVELLDPKSEV